MRVQIWPLAVVSLAVAGTARADIAPARLGFGHLVMPPLDGLRVTVDGKQAVTRRKEPKDRP